MWDRMMVLLKECSKVEMRVPLKVVKWVEKLDDSKVIL